VSQTGVATGTVYFSCTLASVRSRVALSGSCYVKAPAILHTSKAGAFAMLARICQETAWATGAITATHQASPDSNQQHLTDVVCWSSWHSSSTRLLHKPCAAHACGSAHQAAHCRSQGTAAVHAPYLWQCLDLVQQSVLQQLLRPLLLLASGSNIKQPVNMHHSNTQCSLTNCQWSRNTCQADCYVASALCCDVQPCLWALEYHTAARANALAINAAKPMAHLGEMSPASMHVMIITCMS
jgi:hypothetical protein